MTGRYLTGLADVLRGAGLEVVEYAGWQTRARSSGGFADGRPYCCMWHHTASMSDPDRDAAYIAEGDEDAPLANLLIDRAGVVWLIAAGATNTNGAGEALTFSRGTVPDDQMNTHAVGIEIANNGVGEPYSVAQINSAFSASLAICAAEALEPTDAAGHVHWTTRKIDPAAADAVRGPWRPAPINSSGSWSLEDLRAELAARAGASPPPLPGPDPGPAPPLEEDTDMLTAATDANGTVWIGDGVRRFPIGDGAVFDNYVLVWRGRLQNVSGQAITGWDSLGAPIGGATLEALGRADV